MSKLLSAITNFTTLICAGFLLVIGFKCLAKLNDRLKGANVGIVKTSTQPYPGITICPLKVYVENQKYEAALKDCELTLDEYFENGTWHSSMCNKPVELYDTIVGNFNDLIHSIDFELEAVCYGVEIPGAEGKAGMVAILGTPKDLHLIYKCLICTYF